MNPETKNTKPNYDFILNQGQSGSSGALGPAGSAQKHPHDKRVIVIVAGLVLLVIAFLGSLIFSSASNIQQASNGDATQKVNGTELGQQLIENFQSGNYKAAATLLNEPEPAVIAEQMQSAFMPFNTNDCTEVAAEETELPGSISVSCPATSGAQNLVLTVQLDYEGEEAEVVSYGVTAS